MTHEEIEGFADYIKAGQIATSCKAWSRTHAKAGMKLLDLANQIEQRIQDEGGKPAFPVNLSQNHVAAHDTPGINDERVIGDNDVLKIDIGVHVNGFIADCSTTVDFSGENTALVDASENALAAALEIIKPGTALGTIGKTIESVIQQTGFKVVSNLTGHGLDQFVGHAYPTVPNTNNRDPTELEEGMIIAIEPFVSTGSGFVHEGGVTEIFSLQKPQNTRNTMARKFLEHILLEYQTLPFAERWIQDALKPSEFERKVALRELILKGIIHGYPILKDVEGSLVSQAETSVIVTSDGCEILVH